MKNDNYQFDEDEYMEYMTIRKEKTHLPVDIMVDDGGSYKMRNHSLWLLMANGYERPTDEFIPLSVDKFAKIVGNYELKISKSDFEKVRGFIFNNMKSLIELGNDNIDNVEFLENIDTYQYSMVESIDKF